MSDDEERPTPEVRDVGVAPADTAPTRPPVWLPRALLMVVVAAILGVFTWNVIGRLQSVLAIVAIAWFLSLAMEPPVRWLVRHRWRRGAATGVVLLGSLGITGVVLTLFGGLFVGQLVDLVEDLPTLYGDLTGTLKERFGVDVPSSDELVSQAAQTWGDDLAAGALGLGVSLLGALFIASAVLLVAYYMVAAGPRFRVAVCALLVPKRQHEVLHVWEVAQAKVSDFITSRVVLAAISTVATYGFLMLVDVPYALPLAAFTGVVSQFIPTIGTYIGGAVPVAVAIAVSPLTALGVLAFIVGYQQVENLIFAPKVSAHALDLNPAVSFLAVLAFGAVFGAMGAFFALPVAATIQAVSATYVRRHELVDSDLLRTDRRPPGGRSETPTVNEDSATSPDPDQ
jgi:predicted PurR-regulated permease PerM